MNPNCALFDEGAWPDSLRQVGLADELTARLHKFRDDFEGAAAEGHRHPQRTQFAPGKIDLPSGGGVYGSLALLGHHHQPLLTQRNFRHSAFLLSTIFGVNVRVGSKSVISLS